MYENLLKNNKTFKIYKKLMLKYVNTGSIKNLPPDPHHYYHWSGNVSEYRKMVKYVFNEFEGGFCLVIKFFEESDWGRRSDKEVNFKISKMLNGKVYLVLHHLKRLFKTMNFSFILQWLLKDIQFLEEVKLYDLYLGNVAEFCKIAKHMFYQFDCHLLWFKNFWG